MSRRGGKPNRCGGKFNRSRGRGGGGSSGRKANESDVYDYDDIVLEGPGSMVPTGKPSTRGRGRGGSSRGARGSDRGRGHSDRGRGHYSDRGRGQSERGQWSDSHRSSDRPRRQDVRVKLQTLYMSEENQDMVRDMFKDLHGEEPDIMSEEEYDELDMRTEDQYWMTKDPLQIEDVQVYYGKKKGSKMDAECISHIAINKLMRYGYEKKRCVEALQLHDGDIGTAFEYLFCKCFDININLETEVDDNGNDNSSDENFLDEDKKDPKKILAELGLTWEDIEEQRNEEIMALKSIYEDNFTEKIPNKVWSLCLDLPSLKDLIKSPKPEEEETVQEKKDKNVEVCRFYLKGFCRFGKKCHYSHEIPKVVQKIFIPNEELMKNKPDFELEFRFPEDNLYPVEAPIVGFSSTLPNFPPHVCLLITERLRKEAIDCAEMHAPAVFSLVSVLDDETTVVHLYNKPPLEYSQPECNQSWRRKQKLEEEQSAVMFPFKRQTSSEEDYKSETATMIRMAERENQLDEEEIKMEKKRFNTKDSNIMKQMNMGETLKQNRKLKDEYQRKKNSKALQNMMNQRQNLPAWSMQDEILAALESHQVLVVSGMTGCGKTTQVPQFILDSYLESKDLKMCSILCTQPRRISAMAVAERVAEERAEKLGRTVGYQIRLEKVQSSLTRLLFCTTGIVLRTLEGDSTLEGITHIIIDEVHERSEESDFLMMYLKDMLPKRKDLKVILMSATLNAQLFSDYFGGCSIIDIPGRTFPVDQYFLEDAVEFTRFVMEESSPYARPLKHSNAVPGRGGFIDPNQYEDDRTEASQPPKEKAKDENLTVKQLFMRYSDYHKSTCRCMALMDMNKINYDLIVTLLEWIVEEKEGFPNGAVLVFLPGFAEIQTLYEMLQSNSTFGNRNKKSYKIIPLHSTLSSEDQHAVFLKPPEGVTKIVIATNIAETSITIDDIVYVIDAGMMKEKRYDASKGMESLETVTVSRANAQQRKGRAGRVTNGVCFHLFTSHRYQYHMKEQPIPEIQRAPLEQIVLRIKMLDIFNRLHAQEVLEQLPEPPEKESILAAIRRLQDLGALDEQDELTPLGYHLGSLPVDVRVGKLMLFGAIFRCLDPALTIAASLSFKSPFVTPFDKKDEATKKKVEFATGNSDHLTMVKAYQGWIDARKRSQYAGYSYCHDNFLSQRSLEMLASMKQQFVELLSDIGFVKEGISQRDVERAGQRGSDGVHDITGSEANINSSNWKIVAAILVGALYPNVVQVLTPEAKFSMSSMGAIPKLPRADELRFKTKGDGYIHIHPSSVNFQVNHYESPYLVYHEKVKTSRIYIRDCTMVSIYPLLLFGGGSINVDLEKGNFILSVDDGWIRFMANTHQVAELVKELRLELDQLLSDKIQNPHMDLLTCPKGSKIIDTIVRLITTQ
ncbi:putative ATP-dependent RNA helicase DHX57 [Ylistrum balloti]|uniref:putative ATP-dependent RNA helicase DHX57 n=1 Tax=Ylistrum balloti TaxID=509963 RepID=UPI0029059CAA|nr:putative ATP-dependent RNA helicase DHX57 [Ylistrum balloti]